MDKEQSERASERASERERERQRERQRQRQTGGLVVEVVVCSLVEVWV